MIQLILTLAQPHQFFLEYETIDSGIPTLIPEFTVKGDSDSGSEPQGYSDIVEEVLQLMDTFPLRSPSSVVLLLLGTMNDCKHDMRKFH